MGCIISDLEYALFFHHIIRCFFNRHGIHFSNEYDRCCNYEKDKHFKEIVIIVNRNAPFRVMIGNIYCILPGPVTSLHMVPKC